jgi:hypothetical protein
MAKPVGSDEGPRPIHSKIQERARVTPERLRKMKDLLALQKDRVLSARVSLTA